jgi:hypothetical protein
MPLVLTDKRYWRFVAMGKLTWMRATIPDDWNSKEKVLA